jgi:hypothetical protein
MGFIQLLRLESGDCRSADHLSKRGRYHSPDRGTTPSAQMGAVACCDAHSISALGLGLRHVCSHPESDRRLGIL